MVRLAWVAGAVAVLLLGVALGVLLMTAPPPFVSGKLALEPVREGLDFPVALAFAPDGRLFYNELRGGRVRILQEGHLQEDSFLALDVAQRAETGLLGLALHPQFPTIPYVYVYYTYQDGDGLHNRISRFPDLGDLAGPEEVLLDDLPANTHHNSGRLAFGPDGHLYAAVGDALDAPRAQDPEDPAGKILRLRDDGSLPEDNPFGASYAYLRGIRNVFGLAFTPGGVLLFTENGPTGNDEVNRGQAGENYGWPQVQGMAGDARYKEPLLVFTPSIAPTGIAFYTGTALGSNYTQAAYFGSWNDGALRRILGDVDMDQEVAAEVILRVEEGAVLDVVQGPDGLLYLSTPTSIHRLVLEPEETPAPGAVGTASGWAAATAEGLLGKGGSLRPADPPWERAGGLDWSRAPG